MKRSAFIVSAAASAIALPCVSYALEPVSQLRGLEQRYGGRLGVFAIDLGTGRRLDHRAGETFPMCSTFKVLAVGALLQRVALGKDDLSRFMSYTSSDVLKYAPIAKEHLGAGGKGKLSVADACMAAVCWSDNTAANLILREIGGPSAVTAFARSVGDDKTRLDRWEPELNSGVPGDERDTTTPVSMANDLHALIFGNVLGPYSSHLRQWMLNCKTAGDRIPAGLPKSWRSGNKTGTGDYATANDVAFLLPPDGKPKIVAAYFTASRANSEQQNVVLAEVGRIISSGLNG